MPDACDPDEHKRPRLAILVNTVAPYRMPTYAALSQRFHTIVFHGGSEPNRTWTHDPNTHVHLRRVWTIQIPMRKRTGVAGVTDISYIHLNAGLLWELPHFRPDIVISNELGLRTCIAHLYSRLAGIPHWVWWGGTLHSERHIGPVRQALRHLLARNVERWISYGATSTQYLRALDVPRSSILQIQNCIPQEAFTRAPASTTQWFQNEPSPLLLSTGQLIARKGQDRLIEACGRLTLRGRAFTLVLVGEGPEHARLSALARAHKLQHFHILPNQPQAVLNELYRRATAFVFPTLEDVWGLVVNEALWAGCPVLCSTYAGCASEIVPASNVFDPLSPESFDSALETIFDGSLVAASASASAMLPHQQVSDLITQALLTNTLQPAEDNPTPALAGEIAVAASSCSDLPAPMLR